jgi:hypothetical protein
MVNIVEAVEAGIKKKYVFYDQSLPEPLFFRAINRSEYEDAFNTALQYCEDVDVIKTLSGIAKRGEIEELDADQLKELRKYHFEFMMYVCYMGLKDFQPDNFSIDTLRKSFIDVAALSKKILECSVGGKDEIVEVLKNAKGQALAFMIHELRIPLADTAWDLTPLQLEFLKASYLDRNQPAEKGVKITAEMINKDPSRYKEELKAMFGHAGHR